MVMKSVQNAAALNVAASVGDTVKGTAKTVKTWLGRTFSKILQGSKDVACKVRTAIVEFFRNFPQSIRTGYGVGGVFAVGGGVLAIIAVSLNKDKQAAARGILIVAAAAFFFAAGAIMFAFRGNPVALPVRGA